MSFPGEYFISSQLGSAGFDGGGLVIDITGAKNDPGTPLQVWSGKFFGGSTPPTSEQEAAAANQIWSFVPVGSSFFIQSKLNSDLVIDVTGAKDEPGTPLQVWSKKPTSTSEEIENARNQLWTLIQIRYPQPPGGISLIEPGYLIQSALNSDLVIDVKGAVDDPGTPLQVWSKKPTGTVEELDDAKNQLWQPGAAVWIAPPK